MHTQINQLRLELQNLLGRSISKNRDLLELEIVINEHLSPKEQLSYSTLRRFFGFIPSRTPSPKTLASLSKALGYKHYADFCVKQQERQVWDFIDLLEQLEQSHQLNHLLPLLEQHQGQAYYLSHLAVFLKEQLKSNNLELIHWFFDSKVLLNLPYFDRLRIADALGPIMRKTSLYQKLHPLIEGSELAQDIFIYLFVDYSGFMGSYGQFIQEISLFKIPLPTDQLFLQLIRNSIAFFSEEEMCSLPVVSTEKMHPVLKGRYHAQAYLMSEEPNVFFKQIMQEARRSKHPQDYLFEVLPALIFRKDFDAIQQLEQTHYEDLLTKQNWVFEYKKAFSFIAFSLTAIQKGERASAQRMLDLINLQKVSNAYRQYVSLLYCIPAYHLAQDKQQQLERYLALAQDLGFSFFSRSFLQDYYLEDSNTNLNP